MCLIYFRYLIAFFHGDLKTDLNQHNTNNKLNISNAFDDSSSEFHHGSNMTNQNMIHEVIEKHIPCVYGIYLTFTVYAVF